MKNLRNTMLFTVPFPIPRICELSHEFFYLCIGHSFFVAYFEYWLTKSILY